MHVRAHGRQYYSKQLLAHLIETPAALFEQNTFICAVRATIKKWLTARWLQSFQSLAAAVSEEWVWKRMSQ